MRGAWLALSAGLVVASCDDVNVHILTGNQYDQALGCVTASEGVDVVEGPSNGDNCSPQCLVASGDDSSSVYVTTVCPPYPGDYTTEALDAADGDGDPCFGALAAYAAYEDAGATCPATVADAGPDAPADVASDTAGDTGDDDAGD